MLQCSAAQGKLLKLFKADNNLQFSDLKLRPATSLAVPSRSFGWFRLRRSRAPTGSERLKHYI